MKLFQSYNNLTIITVIILLLPILPFTASGTSVHHSNNQSLIHNNDPTSGANRTGGRSVHNEEPSSCDKRVEIIVQQIIGLNNARCSENASRRSSSASNSSEIYSLLNATERTGDAQELLDNEDKEERGDRAGPVLFGRFPREAHEREHAHQRRDSGRKATDWNNWKCATKFRLCNQRNSTHECYQNFEIVAFDEETCTKSMDLEDFVNFHSINNNYDSGEDGFIELNGDEVGEQRSHPAASKVWLYGFLCCTAEIILARVGVIVLPLMRKDLYEKLILTMVGLAAGTLTGSAIFHLLPKAFSLERYYEHDKYLRQCLEIAGGVWLFLVIERTLKIVFFYNERKILHRRGSKLGNVLALPSSKEWQDSISVIFVSTNGEGKIQSEESTDHEHSSPPPADTNRAIATNHEINDTALRVSKGRIGVHAATPGIAPHTSKYRPDPEDIHPIRFQEGSLASVSTEAWMIIFGDGFLDFIDGVSIGTGFQDSLLTGFSISLGILLEELPHELGEFAVLLNAGLTFKQALVLKFISSCTTYLGLCVGVWLGGIEAGHIVFAIAAGMFLYIALVDMMPELNVAAVKSSKYSVCRGFKVLVLQNFGLLVGMAVIYVMALYEELFRKL